MSLICEFTAESIRNRVFSIIFQAFHSSLISSTCTYTYKSGNEENYEEK